MAGVLVFLGFTGVLVGLYAMVRGRLRWARLRNRKQAALVTVAAFLVMITGGALSAPAPAPTATPDGNSAAATTDATTATPTMPVPWTKSNASGDGWVLRHHGSPMRTRLESAACR